MSEQREPFLRMVNVSKRFSGVQALSAVDLTLDRGEIHCLAGENGSGKSTLIKIIAGVEQPDAGARIAFEGQWFEGFHSIDAIRRGVEVIYQDLSLFPNMSVAENIGISHVIERRESLYRWNEVRGVTREAMSKIGVKLPIDAAVGSLSVADQQLVAICRALTSDVRLLIMDEPTSSLTRKEVDMLFGVIKDLQKGGIAALFVSHKLSEVFEIAERVTVLRDGKKIGDYNRGDLDDEKLTYLMTGKRIAYSRYHWKQVTTRPLLEVRQLTKANNFAEVSFRLFPGEILGITGRLGSGRTELAQALFGMNPPDRGEILVDGRRVFIRSPSHAIRLGIGFLPENRLLQGLVMEQSIEKNIVITILERLRNVLRLIVRGKVAAAREHAVDALKIRISSPYAPVNTLSGGNQQRVVLTKWLAINPRILVLDGPTIGVDVAAKSSIHESIRLLAAGGIGIIMISDEVHEIAPNCNRVLLMRKGRIVEEFTEVSEDELQQTLNAG